MRSTLCAALAVCLLVWPSLAAGQAVPACAPDKTFTVKLTSEEKGLPAPLVATHDVTVSADINGSTVGESVKPPADVRVLSGGKGSNVELIVPIAASVPMTVAWRQATDPSDPASDPTDPSASCTASRVVTLDVQAARRSRALKSSTWLQGHSPFAVVPALKRPDLSPLEISVQVTSRARFPSAQAKARTMEVPLRTADQVKYRTKLPGLSFISLAKKCKFYLLTCGSVFGDVSALEIDSDALQRGVLKGDVGGSTRLLARTQPALTSARYGVDVDVRPGASRPGKDRPFGYDVQVRQSGHLIARVRAAGRCAERRDSRGIFTKCKVRTSAQLH